MLLGLCDLKVAYRTLPLLLLLALLILLIATCWWCCFADAFYTGFYRMFAAQSRLALQTCMNVSCIRTCLWKPAVMQAQM